MRVLLVNYHHLDSNSGIQIFNLANHLTRLGVDCLVGVPDQATRVSALGDPLFRVLDFAEVFRNADGLRFDLIHAWTPRQATRKAVLRLLQIRPCPYLVHLEDNEEHLLQAVLGLPFRLVARAPARLLDLILRPYMTHPQHYRTFLSNARGITVIMETLKQLCPQHVPAETIWAGYQEDLHWNSPQNPEYRRQLGVGSDEFLVAYTGNAHSVNRQEVSDLYRAILRLRERGLPVRLVRTGTDYVRLLDYRMERLRRMHCIELGHIPRSELPAVLASADVLVQPGRPGTFNDYRFPSKLPEYLASGRPVILPRTNIGAYLKDREQCLLLEEADARDIAAKIEILFTDRSLAKALGTAGRKFAERHLQWKGLAVRLHAFYQRI